MGSEGGVRGLNVLIEAGRRGAETGWQGRNHTRNAVIIATERAGRIQRARRRGGLAAALPIGQISLLLMRVLRMRLPRHVVAENFWLLQSI